LAILGLFVGFGFLWVMLKMQLNPICSSFEVYYPTLSIHILSVTLSLSSSVCQSVNKLSEGKYVMGGVEIVAFVIKSRKKG